MDQPSLPHGITRELTEEEKWGQPYFNRTLGETIRVRITCQAPPRGRCVANATLLWGKHKLCATHRRMAKEGRLSFSESRGSHARLTRGTE